MNYLPLIKEQLLFPTSFISSQLLLYFMGAMLYSHALKIRVVFHVKQPKYTRSESLE